MVGMLVTVQNRNSVGIFLVGSCVAAVVGRLRAGMSWLCPCGGFV